MRDQQSPGPPEASDENCRRRAFLGSLGKWSAASTMAVVGAAAWLSSSGHAQAGWVNRGSWVNRSGGWINGGGGWINRGGSWVNRGGGTWVNRRGGGGWLNGR